MNQPFIVNFVDLFVPIFCLLLLARVNTELLCSSGLVYLAVAGKCDRANSSASKDVIAQHHGRRFLALGDILSTRGHPSARSPSCLDVI